MKLIINIPDITYNAMLKRNQLAICNDNDIYQWIKNGVPLPKGHGRLIDTTEFIKSINDWADSINSYEAYEELEITKTLLQSHAHTIIEADTESEDKR